MNELASLLLMVSAAGGPSASAMDAATSSRPPAIQLAQLGRVCVTKFGRCVVSPRPLNAQCACGTLSGTIR